MMLDTFDHKIWLPRFYDMDTICSYDNTGQIKFDVDIEMEQGYWNTSTSRLWTRIRDLMHDDLIEIYKDMRANGMSYESFMSYFYDQQIAQIPQSYYNKDADVKYLPFADAYIGKAHGDGYEHLKRWLRNRLIFTDTLFDYQPSYEGDILTIRANTTETMTLEIETYTPVYQHLSWYNGQMDKKKIDGKISVSFSGKAQASTDQEILIYGGTNIKSIKGISTCNPSQLLIGSATRLTELDSNNSPILTDINSDNANLLPHIYLNNLNLSDCVNLSGILKINNSPLIKNVDISNTQLTELQLPSNLRNLEGLKLSDHIRKLDIKNAELLTTLEIPSNIEYLSLINIPKLSSITSSSDSFNNLTTLIMENPTINPISNITSKAPNLQYVRLIGLNISCSSSQIQSLLNMKGIDSFGNEIPIGQAVSGKITLPRCSESMERQFKEEFPLVEFIVNSYAKSYTVTFVDGDGNLLYITQVLENGEAFYVGETPSKTSTAQYDYTWKGWDRQLKPITSNSTVTATFDSVLRYYTVKFINSDTFEIISEQVISYGGKPTTPEIPSGFNAWKPSNIVKVTSDMEYYTQYIPYPEDLSIFSFTDTSVTLMDGSVYNGYTCCIENGTGTSLPTDSTIPTYLIIPFEYNGKPVLVVEQTNGNKNFKDNRVTDVYVPDSVLVLGRYAFNGFNLIETIRADGVKGVIGSSKPTSVIQKDNGSFVTVINYRENSEECNFVFRNCLNLSIMILTSFQMLPGAVTSYSSFANGSANLRLVNLGSKQSPFLTWLEDVWADTYSYYQHFDGTSNSQLEINVVTVNGDRSDVETGLYSQHGKFNINLSVVRFLTSENDCPFIKTKENYEFIIYPKENTAQLYDIKNLTGDITLPSHVDGAVVNKLSAKFAGLSPTSVRGDSITEVAYESFKSCTNLTTVDLPLATRLGGDCFYSCSKLASINIPLATSLGEYCFYGCSALTSIELPSATSLGLQCFYKCSNLTSISIPNATSLGSSCFSGCSALTSIELLNGVTSIGNYCFNNCSSLTSINLPSVTSLGSNCFYYCSSLTSIELPLVTSLGDSCFYGCSALTSIELLNGVTSIGNYCFNNCSSLTSINLPSVTSLGNGCFYECVNLTSIELPLATSLGNDCFYSCSKLASITLPLATSLGEYCFQRCSYLTSMDLPSITKLGSGCFSSCTRLNTVTFGYIGKPISDTSNFSTKALSSNVKTLSIYVTSPSSPPTLTGSPWGATNATITYEQA